MNNSLFSILAGDWSCRIYGPTARDPKRCGSTVGFYNWELLAQVLIFFWLIPKDVLQMLSNSPLLKVILWSVRCLLDLHCFKVFDIRFLKTFWLWNTEGSIFYANWWTLILLNFCIHILSDNVMLCFSCIIININFVCFLYNTIINVDPLKIWIIVPGRAKWRIHVTNTMQLNVGMKCSLERDSDHWLCLTLAGCEHISIIVGRYLKLILWISFRWWIY